MIEFTPRFAQPSVFFSFKMKKFQNIFILRIFLGRLEKNQHFGRFSQKSHQKQRNIVLEARNTENFRLRRAKKLYHCVNNDHFSRR